MTRSIGTLLGAATILLNAACPSPERTVSVVDFVDGTLAWNGSIVTLLLPEGSDDCPSFGAAPSLTWNGVEQEWTTLGEATFETTDSWGFYSCGAPSALVDLRETDFPENGRRSVLLVSDATGAIELRGVDLASLYTWTPESTATSTLAPGDIVELTLTPGNVSLRASAAGYVAVEGAEVTGSATWIEPVDDLTVRLTLPNDFVAPTAVLHVPMSDLDWIEACRDVAVCRHGYVRNELHFEETTIQWRFSATAPE